jgi:glucosamine--fructose-6-phosphate aminotransferase (isomerizing)
MNTNCSTRRADVIEGAYLRDLLEQPQALQQAHEGLAGLEPLTDLVRRMKDGELRRVVLTGMGSSLHGLYPLHLGLSRGGVVSHWVETAEFLHGYDGLRRRDTLLVVASQSGESVEVVNLLQRAAEFGWVLGVTNRPESPLGRRANQVLLLNCGTEFTVSCKSYLNTLAALHWLEAVLLGGDMEGALAELRAAAGAVRTYLGRWRQHVDELLALSEGVQSFFVTGRGRSLATTGTAGLILKESTHYHAEGMSSAAFRHGPLEMIGPKVLVLVFEGEPSVAGLNRRLVEDIQRSGGRAALAAVQGASVGALQLPGVAPALQPVVEMLPVQMLSLALAARDGREAGRFERASKVTTIE